MERQLSAKALLIAPKISQQHDDASAMDVAIRAILRARRAIQQFTLHRSASTRLFLICSLPSGGQREKRNRIFHSRVGAKAGDKWGLLWPKSR